MTVEELKALEDAKIKAEAEAKVKAEAEAKALKDAELMRNIKVKENETAVELLLKEIKSISEGKISKSEWDSTFSKFNEAVDQRNKDTDKQVGELESKFESKLAEMVTKITGAFDSAKYASNKPAIETKYGKNFGEFLNNVKSRAVEIKDLSEQTGAQGGYLVPDQFSSEILRLNLENSVVRSQGARIIPMTSAKMLIPAMNMASNAAGSIYGGVTAYWGNENGSLTESTPAFKRVSLEPKKLHGYCEDPNELEMDAIVSMSNLLTSMFAEVLTFEEDYAFLTEDGVGKPQGILTCPAYITVSRATATQINTTDVIGMIARFKGNMARARFNVNQSALPYIYQLQDPNGNYIWHPGNVGTIAGNAPGSLYGVPINITEKLPALGTTGDLLLSDMGFYLIGDREGLSVAQSEHFKFQNDQMAYRLTKRVDGQPWLDSAITPRAGGSTLSPFVGIS